MFEDVPAELVTRIIDLPGDWKTAKYAAAAYELVLHYTGIKPHEDMFSAFPIHNSPPSEVRLMWLAASLFYLRNEPIMPELCKRMRERDLRGTYFEVSAAAFCKEIGYQVQNSPGKPQRGLDFDFSIVGTEYRSRSYGVVYLDRPQRVAVEVTELQGSGFEVRRMVNSLNPKRQQLPSDVPSVIVCHLPFEWIINDETRAQLDQVSDRFFRGSKRVNVLSFARESADLNRESYVINYMVYFNPSPRHESLTLRASLKNYFQGLAMNAELAMSSQRAIPRCAYFESWVNLVIP